MPMHFLGGLWLGFIFLYIFFVKEYSLKTFFSILFLVLVVGIGWEVFEVIVNKTTVQDSFNYLDTLSDIFFDLSGGACAIFYYFKRIMFREGSGVQLP